MNHNYGTKRDYRNNWSRTAAATGLLGLTLLLAACGTTDEADGAAEAEAATDQEPTTEAEAEVETETEPAEEKAPDQQKYERDVQALLDAGPAEGIAEDASLVKTTEVLDTDTIRIENEDGDEEVVHLALVRGPSHEESYGYDTTVEVLESSTVKDDGFYGDYTYWMERTGATDPEDGNEYVHLFQNPVYERTDAFHLNESLVLTGHVIPDAERSMADDPHLASVEEAIANAREESLGHWMNGEYQSD